MSTDLDTLRLVLHSPAGEAIVDPADRDELLRLVAAEAGAPPTMDDVAARFRLASDKRRCPFDRVAYSKVPGYVSGYGCPVCKGIGPAHLDIASSLDFDDVLDAIAAALRERPAVGLTVGAALRVTHVAEYRPAGYPDRWMQAKAGEWSRFWRTDALRGPSWSMWAVGMVVADLDRPCRLVALADADADPATRGLL